ncbi:protein of unknown function [Gracilibacillus ureilyticus]|uniref:Adenylyltransferase AadA C-terminal domain-containing protein n=1 Tax=Gracilibacillus ureilyticus TaxID=531814 RepID=A0A1H9VW64_9BACI|nr:aminoglycoside adenylyltransferase domain-containing protein [Gracilibacillus ureilyticus]SES25543.1 protein of unknown function [Gracilibacillus ureilyticus]
MSLPKIVETVLDDYLDLVDQHFPDIVKGIFIHGSIALDAYVDDSSDIDFITVINQPLTEIDAETLFAIHTVIREKYPKPELDGVYIQSPDFSKLSVNDRGKYFYYNSEKLLFGEYFNFNPVTWWILNNKGITILGNEPEAWSPDIQVDELTRYVRDNMNSYWKNYVSKAEQSFEKLVHLPTEEIDFQIEWTVLGLLRQFYTLNEYDIISKLGAGKYGLQQLPAEWHLVIKEAIRIRKGSRKAIFNSDRERVEQTINLAKYIMIECNKLENNVS